MNNIKFDFIGLENLSDLKTINQNKIEKYTLSQDELLKITEITSKLLNKNGELQLISTMKGGDNFHQFVLVENKKELILDTFYGNDQVAYEIFSKINNIFSNGK